MSNETPRELDGQVVKMVEGLGITRYYCDYEEDVLYVDGLVRLGEALGKKWGKYTHTGIYKGYWFRELVTR